MSARLYHELASWYPLIDPVADHADEAADYRAAFERAIAPAPATLLELGSGAGHNAFHLKRGLFARATWLRVLAGAGFEVAVVRRPVEEGELAEVFLATRTP